MKISFFLGSDLDGDEMVVLWYKPLIFKRRHAKPMDYPVYIEKPENKNIQVFIYFFKKPFCLLNMLV